MTENSGSRAADPAAAANALVQEVAADDSETRDSCKHGLQFAKLGELFDLKAEHQRLLREQRDLGLMRNAAGAWMFPTDGVVKLSCCHGHVAVKADPDEVAALMEATIERRLSDLERRMAEFGVIGINRELPEPIDDLDEEIPF